MSSVTYGTPVDRKPEARGLRRRVVWGGAIVRQPPVSCAEEPPANLGAKRPGAVPRFDRAAGLRLRHV